MSIIDEFISKLPEFAKPQVVVLYNDNQKLIEENNKLRRMVYGSSSERTASLPQISPKGTLFDEAEMESRQGEAENNETSTDSDAKDGENKKPKNRERSPKSGGRNPLPPHLERQIQVIEPENIKSNCTCGCSDWKIISEDVTEILCMEPAKLYVKELHYPKYGCNVCERNCTQSDALPSILPKTQCDASLLTQIIVAKYLLAIPLYRQESFWEAQGVSVNRTSMARWIISAARYLEPINAEIKKFILTHPVIHSDETTIQVLNEAGKTATSNSYMWVMSTTKFDTQAVYFEYNPSRSQKAAKEFLQNYNGAIHVDGYAGYNILGNSNSVTRIGCWAHARRKFDETIKSGKKEAKTISKKFIDEINELFAWERKWAEIPPDERKTQRLIYSKPHIDKILEYRAKYDGKVLPKTLLFTALTYLNNQWPTLIEFLNDGRFALSNNQAENHIRPFAIGRKNWLFSSGANGAEASAAMYTLVVNAKMQGLDVHQYLNDIFTKIPQACALQKCAPAELDLAPYLPWNWKP